MKRISLDYLNSWFIAPDRKPLVLRGARQVGKTWLVRHFSELCGRQLIEINFEKHPAYASLFSSNNPQQTLLHLSALFNKKIETRHCFLFLDEIQVAPQLLSTLRWFAEEIPELPIIAAGSLLEFVLSDHAFSIPVGRISYMHLEPLSFEEFLLANDKQFLFEYINQYTLSIEIPSVVHEQLMSLFKEYLLIGGMPAVVSSWIKEKRLDRVDQIQNDLLATYRDDVSKYKGRIAIERFDEVISKIPKLLGQKFIYSKISKSLQAASIKQVLELLEKARITHRIRSSAANGVPLGAEVKEKYFKEIFLDVGLCHIALGLTLNQIYSVTELSLINNGGLAEQVVGQLLRTIEPPYIEPTLYCWHREEAGSSAEIDYLLQHGNQIIPIEVKAGSTGSLKSLHFFMELKKLSLAIRINSDYPSTTQINVKNLTGNYVNYLLISLPFYLIGQLHKILKYL